MVSFNLELLITIIIIIIIIINIYIAPILFSAKRFTMLQKGLDKKHRQKEGSWSKIVSPFQQGMELNKMPKNSIKDKLRI